MAICIIFMSRCFSYECAECARHKKIAHQAHNVARYSLTHVMPGKCCRTSVYYLLHFREGTSHRSHSARTTSIEWTPFYKQWITDERCRWISWIYSSSKIFRGQLVGSSICDYFFLETKMVNLESWKPFCSWFFFIPDHLSTIYLRKLHQHNILYCRKMQFGNCHLRFSRSFYSWNCTEAYVCFIAAPIHIKMWIWWIFQTLRNNSEWNEIHSLHFSSSTLWSKLKRKHVHMRSHLV